jgi:hypothetical protein
MIEMYGSNINIEIPSMFCGAIGNYINFLNGYAVSVTDKQTLKLYLQLATFLIDDHYLDYTCEQIFNNWSNVSDMVYHNLDDILQHEVLSRVLLVTYFVPSLLS